MTFTELATPWALDQLERSGVTNVISVNGVDFNIDHSSGFGCSCSSSCDINIEIEICYKASGPRGGTKGLRFKYKYITRDEYALDSLLNEIVDFKCPTG